MKSQRRRLNGETDSISAVGTRASVTVELNETDAVNIHGLRYCASIEPENADANCNGFWFLLCIPSAGLLSDGDFPNDWAQFDDEDYLPYVWGVGCFTASNQAPYHFEFTPRTSRTCQRGARLIGYVVNTGISAGAVRINQFITFFT